MLAGKRLLITGVATTGSIAHATAVRCLDHGADVVLGTVPLGETFWSPLFGTCVVDALTVSRAKGIPCSVGAPACGSVRLDTGDPPGPGPRCCGSGLEDRHVGTRHDRDKYESSVEKYGFSSSSSSCYCT